MSKRKGYRPITGADGNIASYRVDITLGGTRHTPSCNTEDEAIAIVASLRDKHERGIEIIPTSPTKGITIKQAFEQCYNDPENGWNETEHGKKMK